MTWAIADAWRFPPLAKIGSDQLAAVVEASPAGTVCALVNTVIVSVSLWNAVSRVTLTAWLLCSVVAVALLSLRRGRGTPRETIALSRRALQRCLAGAVVAAMPWTLVGAGYIGTLPHANELILIAVVAGMAAGGSVLLAPVYPAALAYIGVVLLPFAAKCFLVEAPGYGLLGLLTSSFALFLVAVVATTARFSVGRTDALRALLRSTEQLRDRDQVITTQNLRFETALNNMNQGLCFFDSEERLIVCNKRFIDMYGLQAGRVTPGMPFGEIVRMRYAGGIHPTVPLEDYLEWRWRAAAKSPTGSDTVHRLSNGRIFAIHYRPMADGAWVATTDDITERERLLEQLARNHALLEERTGLLQAVIDNFPGGIAFFDRELRASIFNDQAKAILGLPESFFAEGPVPLEAMLRFHAERGDYGPGNADEQVAAKLAVYRKGTPFRYERSGHHGTFVEVRGEPMEKGGYIVTFIDITERHQSEAKIAHMASHDALTDLPNRVLFRQRLDEALSACHRGNGAVAVLMLDLNGFKHVNDTLGHPVGDALLAGVAERLQRAVRAEDTIARLGGDEFAIVVHTFDAAREAAAISQRIQAALSQAFDVGEQQVAIGTSIGISVAAHGSGNADRMIKQADTALYRAKAEGGNSYCFFEPSMDQEPGGRIPARRSRTA